MGPCGTPPHLVIFHEVVYTASLRPHQGDLASLTLLMQDNKDLELDIIPASLSDREVKLRDANHEVNEEKRKSARKKEYVCGWGEVELLLQQAGSSYSSLLPIPCDSVIWSTCRCGDGR